MILLLAQPPAVRNALALLPPGVPPIVVLSPLSTPPRHSMSTPVAWVVDGRGIIFVTNWSQPYKEAAQGKPARLAAAIAHEVYHLAHGPDEPGAYDEQIRVLRRLGAPQRHVRDARCAKAWAIRQQQLKRTVHPENAPATWRWPGVVELFETTGLKQ